MSAGIEQMAYRGETPWHGLGNRIIGTVTLEEFQRQAGLNFTVSKQPMFIAQGGDTTNLRSTEQCALVRDDSNAILSYVPNDWNTLQNSEAFDFFREFIESGEMEMHTAGSLFGGKRTWALAKTNETFRLRFGNKEDVIENFLLFSNPHIYGYTITVDMTAIRVVCANTLALALKKASANLVRVSHKVEFDPDVVKTTLFAASKEFKEYRERSEFLASKKAKADQIQEYFNEVFPTYSKKADNDNAGSRNAKIALETMASQPGAELGEGTWWQPFNAVTYLMDHKLGRRQEDRLNNVWFGQMKEKKITALNKALDYAKAA